jgi:hypothetical protein
MSPGYYSYADIEQLIEQFMEAQWQVRTDDIRWYPANIPAEEPSLPYIRLSIVHGASLQIGFTTGGIVLVRRTGVLMLSVFVAVDAGKRTAAKLVDDLNDIFETTLSDPVEFGEAQFGSEIVDEAKLQVSLQYPFTWDTLREPIIQVA